MLMYRSGADRGLDPLFDREEVDAEVPDQDADADAAAAEEIASAQPGSACPIGPPRSRASSTPSTKASTSARSRCGPDGTEPTERPRPSPRIPTSSGFSACRADAPEADVRPFDLARFADQQARRSFFEKLRDRRVRQRPPAAPPAQRRRADLDRGDRQRLDLATAVADRSADSRRQRSHASSRISRATSITSCCRPRRWRRSARRSPASRTS